MSHKRINHFNKDHFVQDDYLDTEAKSMRQQVTTSTSGNRYFHKLEIQLVDHLYLIQLKTTDRLRLR